MNTTANSAKDEEEKARREEIERIRKTPPCPLCSGMGIKAWHPDGLCPFKGVVQ